ncbi:unnamed protein product, partial [Cyprideis torosa]
SHVCPLAGKFTAFTPRAKFKSPLESRHKEAVHRGGSGRLPYQCPVCSKRFARKHAVDEHQLKHSDQRGFECVVCKATFKIHRSLVVHHQIHQEKMFICEVCKCAFARKDVLMRHTRRHSMEKAISLSYLSHEIQSCRCAEKTPPQRSRGHKIRGWGVVAAPDKTGKFTAFTPRAKFKSPLEWSHKEGVHRKGSGQLPYQCPVCSKRFARKHVLKEHRLIHSDKRGFACVVCQATFKIH